MIDSILLMLQGCVAESNIIRHDSYCYRRLHATDIVHPGLSHVPELL